MIGNSATRAGRYQGMRTGWPSACWRNPIGLICEGDMAWSKESSTSRGYGYAWSKLRLVILARDNGICQPCYRSTGRIHPGTEVDHIVSKAKAAKMKWTAAQIDAESNLQCINSDCHKIKTLKEEGKRIKPKIGADGWPIVEKW
jgi:5-methylcytosine-specific restriction enzyme A